MGSRAKAVPVVQPTTAEDVAVPAPAPQPSPTAQRGNAAGRGGAQMAAGFGMNNTILTSPRGLTNIGGGDNRRGTLLGL